MTLDFHVVLIECWGFNHSEANKSEKSFEHAWMCNFLCLQAAEYSYIYKRIWMYQYIHSATYKNVLTLYMCLSSHSLVRGSCSGSSGCLCSEWLILFNKHLQASHYLNCEQCWQEGDPAPILGTWKLYSICSDFWDSSSSFTD